MKTIKNVFLAFAAFTMVIPVFNGCKKGEGDPTISLRSRKGRVVGEWTISTMTDESTKVSTYTPSGGTSSSSTTTRNYEIDGEDVTIVTTNSSSPGGTSTTTTQTGTVDAATFTFIKDGTFEMVLELKSLTSTTSSSGCTTTEVENQTIESTGTWNFLGGVEADFKRKERMVLNTLEEKITSSTTGTISGTTGCTGSYTYSSTSTNSYVNGENVEVWHLSTLKNKELVADGEKDSSKSTSNTSSGGTSTNVDTEVGTLEITLTQGEVAKK